MRQVRRPCFLHDSTSRSCICFCIAEAVRNRPPDISAICSTQHFLGAGQTAQTSQSQCTTRRGRCSAAGPSGPTAPTPSARRTSRTKGAPFFVFSCMPPTMVSVCRHGRRCGKVYLCEYTFVSCNLSSTAELQHLAVSQTRLSCIMWEPVDLDVSAQVHGHPAAAGRGHPAALPRPQGGVLTIRFGIVVTS